MALLLTLGAALLLAFAAWRFFDRPSGWFAGVALLLSTGTLHFATSTMAEPLFLFLICALLWLTEHRGLTGRPGGALLVGVLVGWCLITRTEGLAVLLSMLAYQALARRWRDLALTMAGSVPLWLAVSLWRPRPSPHMAQIAAYFRSGDFLSYALGWGSCPTAILAVWEALAHGLPRC
jgi:hypothetical protein